MGVAFRSTTIGFYTTGQDCTIVQPAGMTAGDVLIALINAEASPAPSMTPPAGWTLIGSGSTSSPAFSTWAYYKVASNSEPSAWTWTLGTSLANIGYVTAYSGQAGNTVTSNPFGTNAGMVFSTGIMAASELPSLSYTAQGNGLGIYVWAVNHSGQSLLGATLIPKTIPFPLSNAAGTTVAQTIPFRVAYAEDWSNTAFESAAGGHRVDIAGAQTTGGVTSSDTAGSGYAVLAGTLLDTFTGGLRSLSQTDSVALTDTVTIKILQVSQTDSAGLTDSVTVSTSAKSVTDSAGLTDSVNVYASSRSYTDNSGLTDDVIHSLTSDPNATRSTITWAGEVYRA